MSDKERLLLSTEPKERDVLLISLPMGWAIIALGYIGMILDSIIAGLSIFFSFVFYSMSDGKEFLGFYSEIAPEFANWLVYLCYFIVVINSTYTLFSIVVLHNITLMILYLSTSILGVLGLYFSIKGIPVDQSLCAMNRRQPCWWENFDSVSLYENWNTNIFLPHLLNHLLRSIVLFIMALVFIFTFKYSSKRFISSFSLSVE